MAYQKYVDLNPADAVLAQFRNRAVLDKPHGGRDRAAAKGHHPNTPRTRKPGCCSGLPWSTLCNFKTEGDEITPEIQPSTVEVDQYVIDLDPNGDIGTQAQQGLESLQAMGVGITTKVGEAPKSKKKGK